MSEPHLPLDISSIQTPPDELDRLGPSVVQSDIRPPSSHRLAKRAAAGQLLQPVMRWLGDDGVQYHEDHILNVLERSISTHCDGYAIARHIEQTYGWSPDSSLVEILDRAGIEISTAHDRLVEIWVRRFDVRPKRKLGDRVFIRTLPGERVEGEITRIDEARAKYQVMCESLGHVRTGVGIHGTLVNYESVLDD